MGIVERREREKAARRRAIMECTKELVISQGVERVNMEDIARKAEISKATLYLYFHNKETLLSEICEDSVHNFLEYLKQLPQASGGGSAGGITGIEAIKYLWQGYVKLFGNSDEMFVVFHVRNFLTSWPLTDSSYAIKSPNVDTIFLAIHNMIEQCKSEGLFDPNLNTPTAVGLVLMLFSTIIQKTARMPREERNSTVMIEEMTASFQTVIRGFAKEGVEHSRLNIT